MTDLDYTPQPAKDTAWQRLWIALGLARRNKTDERQQTAADLNAVWRAEDAERVLRQPGTAEKIAADFARVMGRVGSGR